MYTPLRDFDFSLHLPILLFISDIFILIKTMNVGVEESGVWYSCGYPGCLFRTAQSHRMERHSTFHTHTDRYGPNIYKETKP